MNDNTNKTKAVDAIWADPSRIFGVQFKGGGKRWDTRGTAEAFGLLRTADGTNITIQFNHGHPMAGAKALDVFTYLQDYVLHTAGFKETLTAVASTYNITLEFTPEERKAMERAALAREVAASLTEALRRNPQGEAATYLRTVRGMEPNGKWFGELTPESLKAAKQSLNLRGYKFTDDDFNNLFVTAEAIRDKHRTAEDVAKWGYNLVLPYFHNGKVCGFVLRNIRKEHNGPKYLYSEGLGRVGYCDLLEIEKPAVFVEGQMDAIRLIQAGVTNVVAMGGAKPSEDIARLLKARNISQITYVPDLEYNNQGEQRTDLIETAIRTFQSVKVDGEPVLKHVYVGVLDIPEGHELDKQKVDADTYGKVFGNTALAGVIELATASWQWEIENLMNWGRSQETTQYNEFQRRFNDIYTRTVSPYERTRIKKEITDGKYKAVFDAFGVTPEALADVDELTRNTERNNRLKALQSDFNDAMARGANPAVIANIAMELGEILSTDTRDEWNKQLTQTFADELAEIANQPDTLQTKWELGNITKEGKFAKYGNIEFYPADIEVIAAESSHGKTMFMFQAVFDLLTRYPNKRFLYVSCEENKRQLLERALNVYLDIPTTADGYREHDAKGEPIITGGYCFKSQTRKKAIKAVIREGVAPFEYTGDDLLTSAEAKKMYDNLAQQIRNGIKRYGENIRPRLTLVHTEGTAESITANVVNYVKQCKADGVEVGAVFVDYMQLLTSDGKNYSRHDELKDICKALKGCAAVTELPFIIAAQMNREGLKNGIDAFTLANLGEGADIERIAHDVFFVWQVDKTKRDMYFVNEYPDNPNGRGKDKNAEPTQVWNPTAAGDRANRIFWFNRLFPRNRKLKKGYLYVEQMKARDGKADGWALFPFEGERGYIGVRDEKAMIGNDDGTVIIKDE